MNFLWLNEASGIFALAILLVVLRGYMPYVSVKGETPHSALQQGVFILTWVLICRILYWDFFRAILGSFDIIHVAPITMPGVLVNTFLNLVVIVGAWRFLTALYNSLPQEDKPYYNLLTVAWYPRHSDIARRLKG